VHLTTLQLQKIAPVAFGKFCPAASLFGNLLIKKFSAVTQENWRSGRDQMTLPLHLNCKKSVKPDTLQRTLRCLPQQKTTQQCSGSSSKVEKTTQWRRTTNTCTRDCSYSSWPNIGLNPFYKSAPILPGSFYLTIGQSSVTDQAIRSFYGLENQMPL